MRPVTKLSALFLWGAFAFSLLLWKVSSVSGQKHDSRTIVLADTVPRAANQLTFSTERDLAARKGTPQKGERHGKGRPHRGKKADRPKKHRPGKKPRPGKRPQAHHRPKPRPMNQQQHGTQAGGGGHNNLYYYPYDPSPPQYSAGPYDPSLPHYSAGQGDPTHIVYQPIYYPYDPSGEYPMPPLVHSPSSSEGAKSSKGGKGAKGSKKSKSTTKSSSSSKSSGSSTSSKSSKSSKNDGPDTTDECSVISIVGVLMSGDQEVPPVNSSATATADLTFCGTEVCIFLQYDGIDEELFSNFTGNITNSTGNTTSSSVTGLHIHQGAIGTNGEIVINFEELLGDNPIDGCIEVTSRRARRFLALADEIAANPSDYYINLHTIEFPGGELRGQLDSGEIIMEMKSPPPSMMVATAPPTSSCIPSGDFNVLLEGDATSNGVGVAEIAICNDVLSILLSYMDLEGNVTSASLREQGTNALVLSFDTAITNTSPIEGNFQTDTDVTQAIVNNPEGFLLRIDTSAFPEGEISSPLA
jgi:hypothetical protein